jgi:hypothetical protein
MEPFAAHAIGTDFEDFVIIDIGIRILETDAAGREILRGAALLVQVFIVEIEILGVS